jgi:hypothetical protein
MLKLRLSSVVVIGLIVAACGTSGGSPAGSPGASGAPGSSGTPPASLAPDAIDHAVGATDVVLRMEEGGGFVAMDFASTQAPAFTLYGDRTVVFQPNPQDAPPPAENGPTLGLGWRTLKLAEDQVQDLLKFALGQSGLGIARAEYGSDGIADAPSTKFTVKAGGVDKTVDIYALGFDDQNSPDATARRGFQALADRLRDFDQGGSIESGPYKPAAYRGVLNEMEGAVGIVPVAWPWPAVKPTDFIVPPGNNFGFPRRPMSAEELSLAGLPDLAGSAMGIYLTGPDDKVYSFVTRPLLPDEKS